MVILSIDQALQISGYAVFENNKLVEHGTFSIPKSKPIEQRLGKFLEELTNLYHRYEFEKIIFEDIQEQHKNVVTFKHLAYVQATILNWCYWHDVKYEILAPSVWRKILGGKFGRKREEQKQHAIELVKDYYNIEVTSDEADAICIGKAAIMQGYTTEVAFGSLN